MVLEDGSRVIQRVEYNILSTETMYKLCINYVFYSYHSRGLARILLENILRRYFIKVRKFLGFLEKVKW